MSTNQPPGTQPDSSAAMQRFWSIIDLRIHAAIKDHSRRALGVPRARGMSLNFPIADSVFTPVAGWLQSVHVFHTCRISAWQVHAIVPGTLVLDVRVSNIPGSPSTVPTLVSMPGAGQFPSLNGYAVSNTDTSGWANRDIQAGSVLSIYVISASSIKQCIFGLQLMDLYGKLLQI